MLHCMPVPLHMGTLLSSCACLRWCSHLCGACVHVGHAPECQLDRGRCLEKMGGLSTVTATTGPLRDVLIADDGCVPAWIVRGRCFAAMGCPLLAGLHFEKACTLQKLGIPDVLEQWVGPGARVPGSGASAGSDTTSVTLTHPGAEAAPPLPSPDPVEALAHQVQVTRTLLRSFDARALSLMARALAAHRDRLPDAVLMTVDTGLCEALMPSTPTWQGAQDDPRGPARALALRHLEVARTLKAQADAVFTEAYFATAGLKYRAALHSCRRVEGAEEDVALQARVLEFGCLLNLARASLTSPLTAHAASTCPHSCPE